MANLDELRDAVRAFTEERDWRQFHDPKSLLLALMGEVGELAELYQWLPAGDAAARALAEPLKTRTTEEIADVFIYLIALSDALRVDLIEAATQKLELNRSRFAVADNLGTAPDKSTT